MTFHLNCPTRLGTSTDVSRRHLQRSCTANRPVRIQAAIARLILTWGAGAA